MTVLVRRAARHSDDEIAALTGSAAETDLMTRILAEAPAAGPVVDLGALAPAGATPPSRPGRMRRPVSRRRRVVAMAAVAATVAAATTTLVVSQRDGDSGDQPQWAAETLALADATPRLLVHAPGWELESTDQFEESSGSMTFTDGGDGFLYLEWNQPGDLAQTIANRTATATGSAAATVAGQEAWSFSWPGDEHGAIWQQGDAVVVLMAYRAPMDDGEWAQVLASVEQVDAETWLAALPVDVVQPSELDAVIDELLTGITLPAGTEIATPAGAVTRYQLVNEVERTARCSWIDAWWDATEAGDTAAAGAAATVLADARDWPIQGEIPHHADDAYWEPVESIVRGELPGSRTIVVEGDTPVEEWRTRIDC
jgi:hypothetical protein